MADKGQFSHVINGKKSVEVFTGYGLRSEENIAFVPLVTKVLIQQRMLEK